MNILTLNKIAACGVEQFGEGYTVGNDVAQPVGIMVRSASMHEMVLPESLLAIARAGAGTNNIPVDLCAEKGIVVFNTPGANANAVKELVIAGLLLSSRKIVPAVEWAKTLQGKGDAVGKFVEQGKSAFSGPEIKGKTLGVIGLGAIGRLVANAAHSLGMTVYGFDPYLSVEAAWELSRAVRHAKSVQEVYAVSDYVTVHIPLTSETKGCINAAALAEMKDGVRILNFSRADLVNSEDMLAALANGKVSAYVVDFPTDEMLGVENVIAIPHLGASTPESEDNCAVMAADELKEYLENGNIVHSVNYPSLDVPRQAATRVCVMHKNVPNVLATISASVSRLGLNIAGMNSASKKNVAYTVMDVDGDVPQSVLGEISAIAEVIRVRKI